MVPHQRARDRPPCHHSLLGHQPWTQPIRQKRRSYDNSRYSAMKEEVQKLTKVGFIRKVDYPRWVSNVVMAKKTPEKWRMCVDFTNLNKACPKDSFPLF